MWNQLKSWSVIGIIALGLAGCAPTKYDEDLYDPGAALNGNDAYSMGVGERPKISEKNKLTTRTTKAKNSTYYFDFDKSAVQGEYRRAINQQAEYLVTHPKARILLAGHTDERGSREYNIALGERRAVYVKDILLLNGVAANQIRVVSYGEEKPAALGNSEKAYRLNRRVKLFYEVVA